MNIIEGRHSFHSRAFFRRRIRINNPHRSRREAPSLNRDSSLFIPVIDHQQLSNSPSGTLQREDRGIPLVHGGRLPLPLSALRLCAHGLHKPFAGVEPGEREDLDSARILLVACPADVLLDAMIMAIGINSIVPTDAIRSSKGCKLDVKSGILIVTAEHKVGIPTTTVGRRAEEFRTAFTNAVRAVYLVPRLDMLREKLQNPVTSVGLPRKPVGEGHGRVEGDVVLEVAHRAKAGEHAHGDGGDAGLGEEGEEVGEGGGGGGPIERTRGGGGGNHVVGKNSRGFVDHDVN